MNIITVMNGGFIGSNCFCTVDICSSCTYVNNNILQQRLSNCIIMCLWIRRICHQQSEIHFAAVGARVLGSERCIFLKWQRSFVSQMSNFSLPTLLSEPRCLPSFIVFEQQCLPLSFPSWPLSRAALGLSWSFSQVGPLVALPRWLPHSSWANFAFSVHSVRAKKKDRVCLVCLGSDVC